MQAAAQGLGWLLWGLMEGDPNLQKEVRGLLGKIVGLALRKGKRFKADLSKKRLFFQVWDKKYWDRSNFVDTDSLRLCM